jgi:phage terminase large subunit
MTFIRTTAINKILAMKARKKVIQGSTSAGKTYGIIPIEIDYSIKNPKTLTTFVAESIPAVKSGCVKIFKDVMQDTNRWNEKGWLGNPMQYTFSNGSIIEFKAFDTIGKAKAAGKRDRLFINEANHVPFQIADALMIRSRTTTLDYNPDNEFWAHTEVLPEPNSEFLLLTYLDNEACPPETIEDLEIKMRKAFYDPHEDWNKPSNIKSSYWANWCKVYVRGEVGSLEGIILRNWKTISNIPKDARLLGYGLDFGYSNDPAAIIEVYKYNDQRIANEICHQKGLSNKQLSQFITTKLPVYCDSAEPKSIAELKNYGINAIGVTKGADSILFGIQTMQSQDQYLVTEQSLNLISNLRKWSWDKDKKTGEQLTKPIDMFNDCIDALRYHEMETIGGLRPQRGSDSIR